MRSGANLGEAPAFQKWPFHRHNWHQPKKCFGFSRNSVFACATGPRLHRENFRSPPRGPDDKNLRRKRRRISISAFTDLIRRLRRRRPWRGFCPLTRSTILRVRAHQRRALVIACSLVVLQPGKPLRGAHGEYRLLPSAGLLTSPLGRCVLVCTAGVLLLRRRRSKSRGVTRYTVLSVILHRL